MSEIEQLKSEIEAYQKLSVTMILKMVSPRFYKMEAEAFERYKDASPEEREKICKELGEAEAKILMKEISEEVERRCAK